MSLVNVWGTLKMADFQNRDFYVDFSDNVVDIV